MNTITGYTLFTTATKETDPTITTKRIAKMWLQLSEAQRDQWRDDARTKDTSTTVKEAWMVANRFDILNGTRAVPHFDDQNLVARFGARFMEYGLMDAIENESFEPEPLDDGSFRAVLTTLYLRGRMIGKICGKHVPPVPKTMGDSLPNPPLSTEGGELSFSEYNKRLVTGYHLFANANRKTVQKANPDMSVADVSRTLEKMWYGLDDTLKEEWNFDAVNYNATVKQCAYCGNECNEVIIDEEDPDTVFCCIEHQELFAQNGDCAHNPTVTKEKLDRELDEMVTDRELRAIAKCMSPAMVSYETIKGRTSGYILFNNAMRTYFDRAYPVISVRDRGRKMGKMWIELSHNQKNGWNAEASRHNEGQDFIVL